MNRKIEQNARQSLLALMRDFRVEELDSGRLGGMFKL